LSSIIPSYTLHIPSYSDGLKTIRQCNNFCFNINHKKNLKRRDVCCIYHIFYSFCYSFFFPDVCCTVLSVIISFISKISFNYSLRLISFSFLWKLYIFILVVLGFELRNSSTLPLSHTSSPQNVFNSPFIPEECFYQMNSSFLEKCHLKNIVPLPHGLYVSNNSI
jgi:hypothetical protein